MQDNFFFALRQMHDINPSELVELQSHTSKFFNLDDLKIEETDGQRLMITGRAGCFFSTHPGRNYSTPYEYGEMDYKSFKGCFLVVVPKVRGMIPIYLVISENEIPRIEAEIAKVRNTTIVSIRLTNNIYNLESVVLNEDSSQVAEQPLGLISEVHEFHPQVVDLCIAHPNFDVSESFLNNRVALARVRQNPGMLEPIKYPLYVAPKKQAQEEKAELATEGVAAQNGND